LKGHSTREKTLILKYNDMARKFDCAALDADARALAKRQALDEELNVTAANAEVRLARSDEAEAIRRYECVKLEAERMLVEVMQDVEDKSAHANHAEVSLKCARAVLGEAKKKELETTAIFLEKFRGLPSDVPMELCEKLLERAKLPTDALSWSNAGM
jgi:hypothetical protein